VTRILTRFIRPEGIFYRWTHNEGGMACDPRELRLDIARVASDPDLEASIVTGVYDVTMADVFVNDDFPDVENTMWSAHVLSLSQRGRITSTMDEFS
jgi:hypothetical protein